MKLRLSLILLVTLLTFPLSAQTFFTIASETDAVTFNQASSFSFGALAGTTVIAPKMVCSTTTRNCFSNGTAAAGSTVLFNSNFPDPAPGVTKIVQVLQTTVAQTGTFTHNTVTATWTVPASVPPPPPPPVIPIPQFTVTITAPTMNAPYVSAPPMLNGCITWGAQDKNGYQINGMACVNPPGSNTGTTH